MHLWFCVDAVKHKIPARYESMGRQALKNVAQPIEVWRVRSAQSPEQSVAQSPSLARWRRGSTLRWVGAAVGMIVALFIVGVFTLGKSADEPLGTESAVEAPEKSVAVLPFIDRSPDADQGWLADGFTEQTLNSLTQLRELRVARADLELSVQGR